MRFIYNKCLEDDMAYYQKHHRTLDKKVPQYRKEHEFLKEVDSQALVWSLRELFNIYQKTFRRRNMVFPNFKKKNINHMKYTTPNTGSSSIWINDGFIKLPKLGTIKIRQRDNFLDNRLINKATVICSYGKYYVVVTYKHQITTPQKEIHSAFGLDFSVNSLYVDNFGNRPKFHESFAKTDKKLKRERRKLKKMKKKSKNRQKQIAKIFKLTEKLNNQRYDFLHKISRQIANAFDCVCIEDLDWEGFKHSNKNGKKLFDTRWRTFVMQLNYKLKQNGGTLVKVGRYFSSSQLCSACGYKNNQLKDYSIREWFCPDCGKYHDRDTNAAINIKREGLRIINS